MEESESEEFDEEGELEMDEEHEMESEDQDEIDEEGDEEEEEESEVDKAELLRQRDIQEKFGLIAINDEQGMQTRLKELQLNFYNRLESNRLLKK